jgi:hypothetical protein
LKKDTTVTETTVAKAAVISATRKSTCRRSPLKCVTTPESVTTTSPGKSVTAASLTTSGPVSKGRRGHHRWNSGQDKTGNETFE